MRLSTFSALRRDLEQVYPCHEDCLTGGALYEDCFPSKSSS
jgi:hypothetical protein